MGEQLYGAEHVPDATTAIVTSDVKSAGAINEIKSTFCAVAWHGDYTKAYEHEWSILKGKKIILWPSNDVASITFFRTFAAHLLVDLKMSSDNIRIIKIPDAKPFEWSGYDACSELKTNKALSDFIRKNISPVSERTEETYSITSEIAPPKPTARQFQDNFFRVLGYDHDEYFYLSYQKKQIVSLKPSSHNMNNFLQLAPMDYWEQVYQGLTGSKLWNAATNDLLNQCHDIGVFNMDKVRGVGAWIDGGRVVIHMGDALRINDCYTSIKEYEGKYIYELSQHISAYSDGLVATVEDTKNIMNVFDCLPIKNHGKSKLLAGWSIVAPICGILSWRPHIWLTGQAGVGKSYSVNNIVTPLVGPIAVQALAGTTEAGIRQTLGCDARPIIHDETEGEDKKSREDLQNKIILARAASSDSSASFLKGSTSHKAISFKVRSCFMFSSINVNLKMQSDESRFTVIEFNDKSKINKNNFSILKKYISANLDDENCKRVRARTIRMIPTIKKNISVFAKVGNEYFGGQRESDQYAPMLAGYYSLISDDLITEKEAAQIITSLRLEEDSDKEERNDSEKCSNRV